MTDEDQEQDTGTPAEPALPSAITSPTDVEGHSTSTARAVDDEDDVEGHFGSIRSTGSKGE